MTDFGTTYSAHIPNGQSLSDLIDLGPRHLFAFQIPDAFDGTTLSFTAEPVGGGEYLPIFDEVGTEKTITVAPGRIVLLDPLPWLGIRFFQIRSGTSGAPSVQTGDRIVYLFTVP